MFRRRRIKGINEKQFDMKLIEIFRNHEDLEPKENNTPENEGETNPSWGHYEGDEG